jgi:rod shape-determining protein MreB and related proteins
MLTFLLTKLFPNTAYVRVRRNEFRIRHIESGNEATFKADVPFSTVRMLIGDFAAADRALKDALQQAHKGRFRAPSQIVIHPLELIEGGLSQIEERTIYEVAKGAGASKVLVWLGPELTDEQVKEKLAGK